MGSEKNVNKHGKVVNILYETVGETKIINGLKAKVIKLKTDKKGTHSSLPLFSVTSDVYLRLGFDGMPCQAKVYKNERAVLDFDWSHEHRNPDGTVSPKGVVHVQTYTNVSGSVERHSNQARFMTESEIAKYGPMLLAFNPNVKFRL